MSTSSEHSTSSSELALYGGRPAVDTNYDHLFTWPVVTRAHEEAVLKVLRGGAMSGWDITAAFEAEYAREFGARHALAYPNGTMAILAGLYAIGVGAGDEVVCPSLTYWASVVQLYALGATPVFADVQPESLCLDPADVENCITERTKAIVVVHYAGVPAEIDRIIEIADKHGLRVFEDCSHAHAGRYKGKQVGTFGDAAGYSLMSGKAFAVGEGGVLTTNSRLIYERAVLFGHYERHSTLQAPEVARYSGIPSGGIKGRMHQASSAFGHVQLKHYKRQFAEIDKAMTYFCDRLDQVRGVRSHRPSQTSGSTKGGWYFPLAHYAPEELGGLSAAGFARAVRAEGVQCTAGCNKPLHTHPLFTEMDVYHHGRPTRYANLSNGAESDPIYTRPLPVTDAVNGRIITIPWFKVFNPSAIEAYVGAFGKVADNHAALLAHDSAQTTGGAYSSTFRATT